MNALVHIPMVLPPITVGFALLLIFGANGPVGGLLEERFGLRIAFTRTAVLMASMTVAFPLLVRSIRSAFELTDRSLEEASAILGRDRLATWFRISLPLALPGIIGGVLLGFARAMGEFGATATFAGNIPGETRTLPLAIWTALQIPGDERHAGILSLLSMVLAMTAFAASALITPYRGGRR